MKTFYLGFLFFLCISIKLNGQDSTFIKSSFKGNLYEYFGTRLTYPLDLAIKGVSGFAEIDFRLNNLGKLDSINVISAPDLRLAKEIVNVLVSTKELWTPTKLNGNTIDYKYKLIVEYKIIQGQNVPRAESAILRDKAEKKFNKQKYNDALEIINNAIKLDPFDYRFYDLRSKVFLKIGDIEKKEMDKETSISLEKQIVGCVVIISYSIVK